MQSILPNQIGISPDERNNQLLRLKQTLTSNENLVRVVRRTDLNSLVASDADLASVVAGLRQRITITAQPDGGWRSRRPLEHLAASPTARMPALAAGTVQGLIDAFVEQNLSGDRREASQSLQFLDEELRRREVALQEAEQRRVEFEQRFMGVLPGAGSIADRMTAAQAELANLEQQIASRQGSLDRDARPARRDAADDRPAPARIAAPPPGRSQALEGQLNRNLAQGWTESHPDVVALRQQIARLRPFAAARGAQRRRRHVQSLLRLAARDDRRARGSSPPPPRAQPAPSDLGQLTSARPPSPESPPSRRG
jgi:hypothetical protein